MRNQWNMSQVKEQNKTQRKKLNKLETHNLADAEFSTLIIGTINDLNKNFNKEMKNIKK